MNHTSVRRPVAIALATSVLLLLCLGPAVVSAEPERGPVTTEAPPLARWAITANDNGGTLKITAIDTLGNISGTVFETPMKGFYDGASRRITFETTTSPSSELQVYRGYMLPLPILGSGGQVGTGRFFTFMAGDFEAFSGTGATATRNVYGWHASIFEVDSGHPKNLVQGSDVSVALSPMSLSINANGSIGTLSIASVDAAGNVTGNVFGNGIQGFWDGHQRKLTFIRFEDMTDASHLQIYTGYFTPGLMPSFAGSFEAFSGASAQRNVFGWYATGLGIAPMPAPTPKETLR